jgi:hypothetical protein
MKEILTILFLIYLISCVIILYHTIQSFGAKYKNNINLQNQFVVKMKKNIFFNLSLLAIIFIMIFINII